MPIDTALAGALHVDYLKRRDLDDGGGQPHHTLFQTSTVDALLEGKYDGDVSFADLAGRGDFGLGTLDALDGEMIALGGDFFQVRADGRAYPIGEHARTPFAVVTFFEPNLFGRSTSRWTSGRCAPSWTGWSGATRLATPCAWTGASISSRRGAYPVSESPTRP